MILDVKSRSNFLFIHTELKWTVLCLMKHTVVSETVTYECTIQMLSLRHQT